MSESAHGRSGGASGLDSAGRHVAVGRIVLVLATSTGGIGQHVRSLAAVLAELGVGVTVAGPTATEDRFGFRAAGAEFAPVEIATGPRPLPDAEAVRRLRRLLRGAAAVHAHGLRAGMLAGLALGRRRPTRTPMVVTWHNAMLGDGLRRKLLARMERFVARRADVTLCASGDLVDRARALGAADARLAPVAAPSLPPPARQRDQTRADLGAGSRPVVLAVGRLAPQKDYPTLLSAAGGWAGREPPPLVVVAGEGPERPGLAARIAAEGLPVLLLGQRDDVPDLLAAADVVVLTSVWEARALVGQEALRAGRPLVATAVGGVPEMVGEAALLVPPGDASALAGAVVRVLDDPGEAARLAERGPKQAATWPDEAASAAQVLAVYRELARR